MMLQNCKEVQQQSISQKKLTTNIIIMKETKCPAEELLKSIAGKWKPQILKLAIDNPVRFNALLRQLEGATKQAIATALKELETEGILSKKTIKLKPLHIEYSLTEKGQKIVPLLQQFEEF